MEVSLARYVSVSAVPSIRASVCAACFAVVLDGALGTLGSDTKPTLGSEVARMLYSSKWRARVHLPLTVLLRRAASYGAKFALIEGADRFGGTCVTVGQPLS